MREHIKSCMKGLLKVFLVFAVLCILFNLTFRIIYVDGESMNPTLDGGDWIAACRIMHAKKGDIVLTNTANAYHSRLIKRLIAVGGDTVDIDFAAGTVTVNGEVIDEPYLDGRPCAQGDVTFPLTVPDGQVFLMGDNRTNSLDSRYTEIGCVNENSIIGPVFMRLLPAPLSFLD